MNATLSVSHLCNGNAVFVFVIVKGSAKLGLASGTQDSNDLTVVEGL